MKWVFVFAVWLLAAAQAHAFYNPNMGRWLSRDPLGDSAFLQLRIGGGKTSDEILRLATKALFAGYDFAGNDAITRIDILGLEDVQIVVTTVIRPPDAQAGVKTIHIVDLNQYGRIIISTFTGATIIGGRPFTGTSIFRQWVAGTHPNFTVTLTATSHSAVLPAAMDIDYNMDVRLNFCERKGHLSGVHDQYPSYLVRVKGKTLLDFQQQGTPFNLFGTGNIPIDVDFTW